MDGSVYTPGAGTLPRVLAGRDQLLQQMSVLLNDVSAQGRPRAQDIVLLGPRGVGKTVALTTYGAMASSQGYEVVNLQAAAGQAGLVESLLQRAATRVDQNVGAWTRARRVFERIAGVGFGVAGVSAEISTRAADVHAPRLDPTTLAEALVTLADEVRRDAPTGGLLVTVDEMQVAGPADLALLAATLHRINVEHPRAAVVFAGTGLPHTPAALRTAGVTHPDRLFVTVEIPVALSPADATYAVVEPARQVGVSWHPEAVAAVVSASNGYPAHLQLFADAVWTAAAGPVVLPADVRHTLPHIRSEVARRTLGPRFDRMPDRQVEYVATLAVQGGRTTSNAMARALGRTLSELSSLRDDLIREGDVYSPQRGYVALTMPTFAEFVLDRYEDARSVAETPLLSLAEIRANLSA